jgi:hypothetical protein
MRRRQPKVCLAAATLALLTAGVGRAAPPQEPRIEPTAPKRAATPAAERDGGLPFSGLDLALLTAGGGPLLLIGASLRRRQPKAKVKPASEETLTLA